MSYQMQIATIASQKILHKRETNYTLYMNRNLESDTRNTLHKQDLHTC